MNLKHIQGMDTDSGETNDNNFCLPYEKGSALEKSKHETIIPRHYCVEADNSIKNYKIHHENMPIYF